jgi:hypothetical protein
MLTLPSLNSTTVETSEIILLLLYGLHCTWSAVLHVMEAVGPSAMPPVSFTMCYQPTEESANGTYICVSRRCEGCGNAVVPSAA